ncbi:Hydroxyneurosporene synthase-domain-containing protein [Aspergillus tetrazonus]
MTQSSSCQPCTSRRPLSQPEAGVLIRVSLHGPPKAIEQDDDILDSVVEPQPEIGGHFVARITDKANAAKAPMLEHSLCQRELDKLCRESVDVLIRARGVLPLLVWIVPQGNVAHDPTGPAVNTIVTNDNGSVEHAAVGAGHTDFVLGGVIASRIPALYNITIAQTLPPTNKNPISGYYISSFLTTTAGNQYYVITAIIGTTEVGAYGINILDLSTLQRVAYGNMTVYSTTEITSFNFTREDFAFFGADSTNLAIAVRANASASREDGTPVPVGLDLLVHATSRALYYGGTGSFAFPAAMTSGWLHMSLSDSSTAEKADADAATTLQPINLSASVSWYDCSWGHLGLPNSNYTWFSLYLDDSELILPSIHIRPRRNSSALSLEPIDVFEPDLSLDTIWMSPRSGRVYPQQWKLGIEGRGLLSIQSILGDQEMFGQGQGGESYLGFVTCLGALFPVICLTDEQ